MYIKLLILLFTFFFISEVRSAVTSSKVRQGKVEALSSETLDQFIYGQTALIEFYAPWYVSVIF